MHARATCLLLSEQNDYNNNNNNNNNDNNIRCTALSLAATATGGMQPQPRLRAQPGPRLHRARSRDRCPPRDLQRKSVSQRTARFRMYEHGKCIPCAPLNIRQELLDPFSKDARPRVAVFTRHFRIPTVFPPVEIVFLRCRQAKAEAGHSVQHFEATLLPCSSTAILFSETQIFERECFHCVLCLQQILGCRDRGFGGLQFCVGSCCCCCFQLC